MKNIKLRKWQQEAIVRSDKKEVSGVFLEAPGGFGKTVATLAICEHKDAKRVMVLNNAKTILEGWEKAILTSGLDQEIEFVIKTDKWLDGVVSNLKAIEDEMKSLKAKIKDRKLYNKNLRYKELRQSKKEITDLLTVDVLIIDEWQNMCSAKNTSNYLRVARDYSIGLSATPIRQKGLNFFPLEKTFFGKAVPNEKNKWVLQYGLEVIDKYAYTGRKWEDFRDYDSYVESLPNFMRWETIVAIEEAKENNGEKIEIFRPRVEVTEENLRKLELLRLYNIVEVDGQYLMPKSSFGRKSFERYLKQSVPRSEFPKLRASDKMSPLMLMLKGLIDRNFKRNQGGLLIVGDSVSVMWSIYEQNKGNNVGFWSGEKQIDHEDCDVLIASSKVLGVGVDGLQFRFDTMVILDPVSSEEKGYFNDYRQLLWRVTGMRQQHKVNIIEVQYLDTKEKLNSIKN